MTRRAQREFEGLADMARPFGFGDDGGTFMARSARRTTAMEFPTNMLGGPEIATSQGWCGVDGDERCAR